VKCGLERRCTRSAVTGMDGATRCCMCPIVSAATSDRRNAQPRSTAIMARSRRPFVVVISGALSSD